MSVPFPSSIEAWFSLPVSQVLRTHVMVRVGGGWDTLEHYLDKHDPCRCAAFGEVTSCSPFVPYKTVLLFMCCIINKTREVLCLTVNVRDVG